jgi:hypothetical protein
MLQSMPIQKLNTMSFTDLYAALNKLDLFRDRFIGFPHVADGGYKTLLRHGFEKHYIGGRKLPEWSCAQWWTDIPASRVE